MYKHEKDFHISEDKVSHNVDRGHVGIVSKPWYVDGRAQPSSSSVLFPDKPGTKPAKHLPGVFIQPQVRADLVPAIIWSDLPPDYTDFHVYFCIFFVHVQIYIYICIFTCMYIHIYISFEIKENEQTREPCRCLAEKDVTSIPNQPVL